MTLTFRLCDWQCFFALAPLDVARPLSILRRVLPVFRAASRARQIRLGLAAVAAAPRSATQRHAPSVIRGAARFLIEHPKHGAPTKQGHRLPGCRHGAAYQNASVPRRVLRCSVCVCVCVWCLCLSDVCVCSCVHVSLNGRM